MLPEVQTLRPGDQTGPGVRGANGNTRRYRCGRCGHTFVRRGGFERMRKPDWAILDALNDFFKGHSPADIADTLDGKDCHVHPDTIHRWIVKFIGMTHAYLRTLPVRTGERFCADEVFGATSSGSSCLFSVTDQVTRFCLAFEMADRKDGQGATALLEAARDRAGKVPAEFVSDGLPSYGQAHRAVFAARTPLDKCSVHVGEAAIHNKKRNNNVQERFNGTFRAFQRPRRGIKSASSQIIVGFFVYYNFVRSHTALGGRTPAQAAGITIHGHNKWQTMIGNAALAAGGGTVRHLGEGHPHGPLRITTGPADLLCAPPKDICLDMRCHQQLTPKNPPRASFNTVGLVLNGDGTKKDPKDHPHHTEKLHHRPLSALPYHRQDLPAGKTGPGKVQVRQVPWRVRHLGHADTQRTMRRGILRTIRFFPGAICPNSVHLELSPAVGPHRDQPGGLAIGAKHRVAFWLQAGVGV